MVTTVSLQRGDLSGEGRISYKKFSVIKVLAVLTLLIAVGVSIPYFTQMYADMVRAQKKSDMRQMMTAITLFTMEKKRPPRNVAEGWCVVGKQYPEGQCMGEILASGHLPYLPESPDDEPYYYYATKEYAIVATRLNPPEDGEGQSVGRCAPGDGDKIWCLELKL